MRTVLGVHDTLTDSARRAADYPGHRATREFLPGVRAPQDLIGMIDRMCADTWRNGHTAGWSFKPDPRHVADGTWRRPIQDLGAHLYEHRGDRPTLVVIWHEPENDIGAHFDSPEHFVTTFNTVHGWLTDGRRRQILTCHAALGYAYRDGAMTDAEARRWRTRAHVHAVDAYSGRTFPLAAILPEHTGYRRWRRELVAGRRWAVTERGWTCRAPGDGAVRVAAINREFRWLGQQERPPYLYLIWGSSGRELDPGMMLDPDARRAVADGFARLDRR